MHQDFVTDTCTRELRRAGPNRPISVLFRALLATVGIAGIIVGGLVAIGWFAQNG